MSISLGMRPGTHSALLPEAVMPNRTRPPRLERSSSPDMAGLGDGVSLGVVDDAQSELAETTEKPLRKAEAVLSGTTTATESRSKKPAKTSLKISLPPLLVDPDEPRYCYCNQVSYGEVCAKLLRCCKHRSLTHNPFQDGWLR